MLHHCFYSMLQIFCRILSEQFANSRAAQSSIWVSWSFYSTFFTENNRSVNLHFGNHPYFTLQLISKWKFLICLQKTDRKVNDILPDSSYNFVSWQFNIWTFVFVFLCFGIYHIHIMDFVKRAISSSQCICITHPNFATNMYIYTHRWNWAYH